MSAAGDERDGPGRARGKPGPEPPLVHKTLVYSLVRLCVLAFLRLYNRARVEGIENLPPDGAVVLASNHQSLLDIPLIAMSTRRHVCFLARASLARSRPLAFLMRRCGAVLVRRGTPDRAALKAMIEHLERGDVLAVFPEGTRSLDGRLRDFRGGALLAARRARAPVVPVGIRGTRDALPRDSTAPRRRPVAIRYGAPIDPRAPDALERTRAAIEAMVGDGAYHSVPPLAPRSSRGRPAPPEPRLPGSPPDREDRPSF